MNLTRLVGQGVAWHGTGRFYREVVLADDREEQGRGQSWKAKGLKWRELKFLAPWGSPS